MPGMWTRIGREIRRAGPRKVAVIVVAAVLAVALAYGNNSTNDAASGRTLPTLHSASAADRP